MADDLKDVIARLRPLLPGLDPGFRIVFDAADRIEALMAENNNKRKVNVALFDESVANRARIEALEKDVQAAAEMYRMAHAKLREQAWRPMETAPRDGTRILLCGDPKRYGIPVHIDFWNEWAGNWNFFVFGNAVVGWLPLPQPPEAE